LLRRVVWGLLGALCLVLACAWLKPGHALPQLSLPGGGVSPDVWCDSARLHLVYGRDEAVYYTSSTDDGKTLTTPRLLNDSHTAATVGRERGAKLAIGRNGLVHVVWLGPMGKRVFYTHDTHGGRFMQPQNLLPQGSDADGPSVAADDRGRVYVVWLRRVEGPDGRVSARIELTVSNDDGRSFSAPETIENRFSEDACPCCQTRALMGPDRAVTVAFRGAYRNLRDIYLIRGEEDSQRFAVSQVSDDHWRIDACPMAGPFVQAWAGSPRRLLTSWASDGEVYFAVSEDAGRSFGPRTAPSERNVKTREHPIALANPSGERLFAWVEGRGVRWQRITADGHVQSSGENTGLPANSRPTAFVDRSGGFVLVY
jgi:hypothetical protein